MVWAGAIPYSYLEWLLRRNPNLVPSDVLRTLMGVLVTEIEELHNSLVQYGCDNFVLIGVLIVHGAPHRDLPRVHHQSVRVSTSRTQRSMAYMTFFESKLRGAHFVHTEDALVAMECNRVMQCVAPYMTWERYLTHNRSFLYNPYMELSVWEAPLQLDDHSRHAVRPVLSSGVPPGYEYQLQMQPMSTQDMLETETAPLIVSDSTLLHWSVSCKLITLGMDKCYIIGDMARSCFSCPRI